MQLLLRHILDNNFAEYMSFLWCEMKFKFAIEIRLSLPSSDVESCYAI